MSEDSGDSAKSLSKTCCESNFQLINVFEGSVTDCACVCVRPQA